MAEEFYKSAESIVNNLIQLFKLQSKSEIVDLLEKSQGRIEQTDYHDTFDGGMFIYTLFLNIPIKLFAHIESKIEQLEIDISEKLTKILRDSGRFHLEHVIIAPIIAEPNTDNKKSINGSVDHIWQPDSFRLFLSHSSHYKKEMSKLKDELTIYNISGFVAHQDIKPTKAWENEILLALHSADALVAFLTPDFHESKWTDQEVGITLGLGKLVIAIVLDNDPYGFMAKNQAVRGSLDNINQLTNDIIGALLQHDTTMRTMHESLALSLENAESFIDAKRISQAILKANNFTQEQLSRIQQACKNNYQVAKSYGVPEAIGDYLINHGFVINNIPFLKRY